MVANAAPTGHGHPPGEAGGESLEKRPEEQEESARCPQGPTNAASKRMAALGWESEGGITHLRFKNLLTSIFQFKTPEVNKIYVFLKSFF